MMNQFPSVKATVDVAIVDYDNFKMLLARKPHETLHRFVGGFSDPNSESFEHDAKREVLEETGLTLEHLKYIGSAKIDDWRYRNEKDKIKTMFFAGCYVFGAPQANDDIAEVKWFTFETLFSEGAENLLVPNHRILLKMLLETLPNPARIGKVLQ